jgi:hypothetical protein
MRFAVFMSYVFFVALPLTVLGIGGAVSAIVTGQWYFAPLGAFLFFVAIFGGTKLLNWYAEC